MRWLLEAAALGNANSVVREGQRALKTSRSFAAGGESKRCFWKTCLNQLVIQAHLNVD